MATKVLKSIKGRALRITRLDECGAPVPGPCSTIVSHSFVSVTLSAEVESGEEQSQKNAWGEYCVNDKDPDITKWVNTSIVLCEIHPDILDVIGGANPVIVGGDTVGVTFGPQAPTAAFAIEVWTKKSGSGACGDGGVLEWGYFVVPWIRNGRIDGDVTIENAPLNLTLVGEGIGASGDWGVGPYTPPPFGTFAFPAGDLWGMGVTAVQPPEPTNGCAPLAIGGADPSAVEAGDEFPADPAITASDAPNAALLESQGYLTTGAAWATGEFFSVGEFQFYWNGTAWQPGDAP